MTILWKYKRSSRLGICSTILSIALLLFIFTPSNTKAESLPTENKTSATEYFNDGSAKFKLEQYEQAILSFDKAIALNPDYEDAYGLRGLAYEHLRHFDKAIADLSKAIEISPQPGKYCLRGRNYFWDNQLKEAVADLSTAISLNPRLEEASFS